MRHSTSHCELCGTDLSPDRQNGWAGTLSLKGNGNMSLEPFGVFEQLEVCQKCGVSILGHIKTLQKKFTVKTVVEYGKDEDANGLGVI